MTARRRPPSLLRMEGGEVAKSTIEAYAHDLAGRMDRLRELTWADKVGLEIDGEDSWTVVVTLLGEPYRISSHRTADWAVEEALDRWFTQSEARPFYGGS